MNGDWEDSPEFQILSNEVEELKRHIASDPALAEVDRLRAQAEKLKDRWTELQLANTALRAEVARTNEERQALRNECAGWVGCKQEWEKKVTALRTQVEEMEEDKAKVVVPLRKQLTALRAEVARLEAENKTLREKNAAIRDDVNNLRIAAEARIAEVDKLRARLAEKECPSCTTIRAEANQRYEEWSAEVDKLRKQVAKLNRWEASSKKWKADADKGWEVVDKLRDELRDLRKLTGREEE